MDPGDFSDLHPLLNAWTDFMNDANGSPNSIDFSSFFQVREYFKWVEVGWAPRRALTGDGIHLAAWHADTRTEEEIPESWGVTFSAARKLHGRWHPFLRAGYSPRSDESPVLLSAMLSLGLGVDVRTDDRLGVAVQSEFAEADELTSHAAEFFLIAWCKSQSACKCIQNCGVVLNRRARRSAVSAVTPRLPRTSSFTRFTDIPSSCAAST